MTSYRVEVKPSARRELMHLPAQVIARIVPRMEELASNLRPPGCKKLRGGENHWRIRVGEYRVVYTVNDAQRLVEVTRIRHRSSVYGP